MQKSLVKNKIGTFCLALNVGIIKSFEKLRINRTLRMFKNTNDGGGYLDPEDEEC
jgi:hypothetical protein